MIVQVLGVSAVNFTNGNGDVIKGTNIYAAFPDENCQGMKTEKFYLKDGIELPDGFKLNSKINLFFNMTGKVEAISLA